MYISYDEHDLCVLRTLTCHWTDILVASLPQLDNIMIFLYSGHQILGIFYVECAKEV